MSNSAEQLIYKAAIHLDHQGDPEEAVAMLRDAINVAEVANRPLELVRAHTFLGELLADLGRSEEAVAEFRLVVKLGETFPGSSDLVDQEVAAATRWIAELETQ